jgi:hypothetical protein
MISQELLFNPSNALQVFAYEGFQYVISNPDLTYTLQNVTNSTGLNPTSLYFTKNGNSNYVFGVPDASNNLTPGTTESFVLSTVSGTLSITSSNTVTVNPGRFLDGSGNSLSNNAYVFFKNERIQPIRLVAPTFTLKTPTSIPSLPPGLSFVRDSSSSFDISGIPTVAVPSSNYQIIGVQSNGSKIVTTTFNMVISNERLRTTLSGASIINNMEIGTAISPRVITAIPPLGTTSIRYTFPTLPDGIVVQDVSGNAQPSPFIVFASNDPSYTCILAGTPTSNAAISFRNAGITSFPITVQAARLSPSLLEANQAFTFFFKETVLFDTPTLRPLFVDVPVDQSSNFFRAATYFTSNVDIANIFSPDLRSDLSLVFIPALSRANLSGTPLSAGTGSYTIRAINSNGISGEVLVPLTVSNDSVTFSSPIGVDLCYSFILSRPLTQFKEGYYTSNIQFTAAAASTLPVSLSAPLLAGTGLSLNSNGVLTGIPSTVTPLTTLDVVATVSGSPATATKQVKFAILDDTFTFTDVSASNFNFIQNIPVTQFRIPVTTLSERSIINYSQTGFPTGVTIGPAGVVQGTPRTSSPAAGNVTVTATTGYSSGSRDFSFNLTPDTILFTVPQSTYLYEAGDSVLVPITGTSFSGNEVSNYALTLPPSYGLSMDPTSGLLSGQWTNSIPPNQVLPSSCNFTITADSGVSGSFPVSFTANPILERTSFVWSSNRLYANNESNWTRLGTTVTGFTPPAPVARYDFNTYTNQSITIASSVAGPDPAAINLPTLNTFVQTNSSNKYLTIYAPSSDLQETGGVLLPFIANVTAVEVWVRYTNTAQYSQYFIDGRTGAANSFWITSLSSTDFIGSFFNNATIYFNGVPFTVNSTAGTPDIGSRLLAAGGGWVQVIIVPTAPISDDITLFVGMPAGLPRIQGMPVSVADIAVYQSQLTLFDIQSVFNAKCSRYGLSPITLMDIPVGFDITIRNSNVDGNLILATASNYILRSFYKDGFNATNVQQNCSSLTYKAPSEWWASGTRDYSGTQRANVLYSDDNGITWSPLSILSNSLGQDLLSRDSNAVIASSNPYLSAGVALQYKSGVLLAGGYSDSGSSPVVLRSTDDGVSWNDVTGGFTKECAYFNVEDPSGTWIATGSDRYSTKSPAAYTVPANTIKYSTDQGQTWSNAVSGAFTMIGYELRYANNTWVATGVDGGATYDILYKYSTDGSNWSPVNLGISPNPFTSLVSVPTAPLPLGSVQYDGSNWNIFVQRQDASLNWLSELYSTPDLSTPVWTVSNVTSSFTDVSNNATRRFVTYTRPQYLRPTTSTTIDIVLSFASAIGNGPTITSSLTSDVLLYQFIYSELQLSSTGSNVYFFIRRNDLPPGLTFNPSTNMISGKPSQIGTYSTPIYAKDASGVTLDSLTFTVIVPRVIRQQDGAGAYTSLLRQYTEVLAAQNARDKRVLPAQTQRLGEFMSPVPGDVITSPFTTTKCKVCRKEDCPTVSLSVDGSGTQVTTCSALDGDASGNEFIDVGTSEANICD